MPAPLAVDKEQVRMLVLDVGVREAARKLGLAENTVLAWSNRGNWLAHLSQKPKLPASMQGAICAISPAQALQNTLEEDSQACKTHALRYAKRTLKHAADLAEVAPDEALTQAPNVQSAAKTAALAGAWGADRADVRINVFSDSSRVIDVESLPSAGDERT